MPIVILSDEVETSENVSITTSNNTPTVLFSVPFEDGQVVKIKAEVVAHCPGHDLAAGYEIEATYKYRDASLVIIGSEGRLYEVENDSLWDVYFDDDGDHTLQIKVVGSEDEDTFWVAKITSLFIISVMP